MMPHSSFKRFWLSIIVVGLTFPLDLFGQASNQGFEVRIPWQEKSLQQGETPKLEHEDNQDKLPQITRVFELDQKPSEVKLIPTLTADVSKSVLPDTLVNKIANQYRFHHAIGYAQKQPYLTVTITPLKKANGTFELLQEANIKVVYQGKARSLAKRETPDWPNSSPLADGQWYRIGIDTTGIFKLTHDQLKTLGLKVNELAPGDIQLYGNGGQELPQNNNNDHPKGLKQTPIAVKAGGDGSFDKGDYILFYGKGAHGWAYHKQKNQFRHNYHPYSNQSYYFLTVDADRAPKRVQKAPSLDEATYSTQTFNQLLFHEQDKLTAINRDIRSGRRWFGEVFSRSNSTRRFTFQLTGNPDQLKLRYRMAHHWNSQGIFRISTAGKQLRQVNPNATTGDYTAPFANVKQGAVKFSSDRSQITLSLSYQGGFDSKGWLDYLALTGRTPLRYNGKPLMFQDKKTASVARAQYQLKGLNPNVQVWDVTSPQNVHRQALKAGGNAYTFTDSGQQVRRYLAFTPDEAGTPSLEGKVENQNLHALPQADMLIVTHPRFKSQAQALGRFHKQEDGLSFHVVTPQAIFNEFSSGKQDITAIRWFVKMFYDRANSRAEQPKYLALFGDASFDYKDRLSENTNLVPTYQTPNSTAPLGSFASDDYFGYLDDQEGVMDGNNRENFAELLDISVGRIPVTTKEQANDVIEKVKRYYRDKKILGSWQNRVTFVADDMEEGWEDVFVLDSEEFTSTLNKEAPAFNMDKIYMDAYEQKTVSGGKRYPGVEEALTNRMKNGSLVINYMGHGGERGLANERIVTFDQIKKWDNPHRMPLFVTATCEYTRYDDPGLLSAGERTFLKPDGGAIALLSTTRLVTAGSNTKLTRQVFENNMFQKVDGEHKTIGEVFLKAKNDFDRNNRIFSENTRKFGLIGDPALKLAYPKHQVVTTRINRQPFSQADSLKALQKVTLKGEVRDYQGNRLTNFNGTVNTTIYDKKTKRRTRANDPAARKMNFKLLNSVIYDGQTVVENGRFQSTFVVPKDIAYKFGKGKVSYYASNHETDAHGYSQVTVGGTANNPVTDTRPPKVDLFLNSTDFEDGGITSTDPLLLAKISDDNGINTAANGIGHLPQLTIDGQKPVTLEDAYQASVDTFNQGTLRHQLMDLEPGQHYLELKVWDVANKVGSDQLSFVVVKDQQLTIESLTNYPNPFADETTIAFEHNQRGRSLTARIRIYNIRGQMVTGFKRKFAPEASRQTINWNGTSGNGRPLEPGVYVCEVILKGENGATVQESNRLVIQK